MKRVKSENQLLSRGQYLAPHYVNHDLGDLLVGITEYKDQVETGIWHSHERPMLSFVLAGGNQEQRQKAIISRVPGSINFYRAFEPHRNIYKEFPSKHLSLELDDDFLVKNGLDESQIEVAIQKSHHSPLTFVRILHEVLADEEHSKSAIELLFLELISNSLQKKEPTNLPSWLRSVEALLNDRWNENISLQELAREAGVHPITISKHFSKYFLFTLGEYVRKLRIERAIALIGSSSHTLTEIAHHCGFSDQSHFIRVFKKQTGFLPLQYKRV